ncbi:helix-turn-helix domain-containing protein [Agrococcus sp. ARC_14]|uniref:helix-turn-helix domain-containing protein n=1 Tax=Agrococcus sp. ARC_14 TaxID=2919927 RepID=UPI001F068ED6|nr:helix-turn-helix domain-containing protein [Agrococcus sp. ARC_14]MCH1881795.1 helix-turn-helix domain-containing protein [Agrococcus sp. ARC_14]
MERLETTAAWGRLLERLALDHDALVDDFIERLRGLGSYDARLVSEDDLRRTAGETMDMLIARLAGAPLSEELRALPARLGARRARQGVDRESLLEAVRLDFRVLWSGLLRALGDAPADLLVLHAEEVLEVVERYIGDVQVAFLDEQSALAQDTRIDRARALGRLLGAGAAAPQVADAEAARLQLPLDGTFEVAFVLAAAAERARRSIARAGGAATITWDADAGVVVVREGTGGALAAALEGIPGGHVPGVRSLAGVPAAAELAREIAAHAGAASGLATEQDTWLAIAHTRLAPVLPSVAGVRTALEALPAGERERVIATVRSLCATGSVKETAAAQFVHRNTIVNRVAAFRAATGLDVSVPAQAAIALLGIGGARRPER